MLRMGMIKKSEACLDFSITPAFQHSNTPALQYSSTPILQHSNTPVFLGNVSGMPGPPIDCDEEIT
jgi:hypothetical protein